MYLWHKPEQTFRRFKKAECTVLQNVHSTKLRAGSSQAAMFWHAMLSVCPKLSKWPFRGRATAGFYRWLTRPRAAWGVGQARLRGWATTRLDLGLAWAGLSRRFREGGLRGWACSQQTVCHAVTQSQHWGFANSMLKPTARLAWAGLRGRGFMCQACIITKWCVSHGRLIATAGQDRATVSFVAEQSPSWKAAQREGFCNSSMC